MRVLVELWLEGQAEFGRGGWQVVLMNELQCVWLPGRTVKPAVTKMGSAAAALLFLSLSGESFFTKIQSCSF